MAGNLFDDIVIVDWSARGRPSPARQSKDAIWIATACVGAGSPEPLYFRTRFEALGYLATRLDDARARGRRLLIGFDFPFGYPVGTAERLTGRPEAAALWQWLGRAITDGPDNLHNAFETGARINAHWPGAGPCWGHPHGRRYSGLGPKKGGIVYGAPLPAERRVVERWVARAKSTWQLAYAGSVGAQALTGIAGLERLKARFSGAVAVWPFDTGLAAPTAPMVLAEVYPSLFAAEVDAARAPGEILDRAQTRVVAERFAELDAGGRLASLFAGPPGLTDRERWAVATEEAWILGVG